MNLILYKYFLFSDILQEQRYFYKVILFIFYLLFNLQKNKIFVKDYGVKFCNH